VNVMSMRKTRILRRSAADSHVKKREVQSVVMFRLVVVEKVKIFFFFFGLLCIVVLVCHDGFAFCFVVVPTNETKLSNSVRVYGAWCGQEWVVASCAPRGFVRVEVCCRSGALKYDGAISQVCVDVAEADPWCEFVSGEQQCSGVNFPRFSFPPSPHFYRLFVVFPVVHDSGSVDATTVGSNLST